MSSTIEECLICLQELNKRGGVPIATPGCCGKSFHAPCISQSIASKNDSCPNCRVKFHPFLLGGGVLGQTSQVAAPINAGFGGRNVGFSAPMKPKRHSEAAAITEECVEEVVVGAVVVGAGAGVVESDERLDVAITMTEEFPEMGLAASEFHVRARLKFSELKFSESAKVPLDVVCILDNSGSMQGGKLQSLKEAMQFVIASLDPRDRLSIVYFNSRAGALHGLIKMTPENKDRSRQCMSTLTATGGTDIFDGMRLGWDIFSQRKTRNPASCVFLLTDGQDTSNTPQKLELARSIKASGASLFCFGFGQDHDSAHMTAISNAAEGPFTYIETDDTVADAFGGAMGTVQGSALRGITLSIGTVSENIQITAARAGSYPTVVSSPTVATVSFANLYCGELRDVLITLAVPAITGPHEAYPLIRATASYTVQGSNDGQLFRTDETISTVQRLADAKLTKGLVRNLEVDAQMNRAKVAIAIAAALVSADQNNLGNARQLLQDCLSLIRNSSSFASNNALTLSLVEDVNEALMKVQNQTEYSRGGRAQMCESESIQSRQRSNYTKIGKSAQYQSTLSCMQQDSFAMQKSPSPYSMGPPAPKPSLTTFASVFGMSGAVPAGSGAVGKKECVFFSHGLCKHANTGACTFSHTICGVDKAGNQMKCRSGFKLSKSNYSKGAYATGWACDKCSLPSAAGIERWTCVTCNSDVCFKCNAP